MTLAPTAGGTAGAATTPNAEVIRHRPSDLLTQMSPQVYREANKRKISVSALLERDDPSEDHRDGLDAFERVLRAAEIHTNTLSEYGVYADEFVVFDQNEQTRSLVPEWVRRQWRRTVTGKDPSTRNLYASSDQPVGSVQHPWVYNTEPRVQQIAPAIPLAEVVTVTTPIEGDAYRAFYMVNDPTNQRMVRVSEGSEIPRAKLVGADHTVRLKKFGRVLEVTYEQLRRQRIDMVALHVARMAIQAEADKVAAVLDILVNGDGNASTAATVYGLTGLDSAASGQQLTLKAWIAFKLKFTNPYMLTTALAQDVTMEQAMLLNTGSANIPLVFLSAQSGFGSFTTINPGLGDQVAIGWTPDAAASKIIGFDRRFAVERVVEIGSDITEIERWSTRQTQALTMTENEGYAILDPFAVKVLDLTS